MLDSSYTNVIHIPNEQMEPFMDKVLPGLKKLGHVHISSAVTARIVQPVEGQAVLGSCEE